ncbi:MAG: tyrosine-type recombinase/integrase [Deltaproteobacteria bacterium]|nr:tyrosine-type recombinase/integrase [Deltaproteobacteria bacterium]MBI4795902.1 tyrosine-type recombinase/integrase [Deltaproteobacteria bacterium]
MWLHGRPPTTQKAYAYEVQGVLAAVGKPLAQITLGDLQSYFSTLESLAPASRARAINAVKSLFSFAQRIGYLHFNPAAAVQGPKIKNTLAERILSEAQVHRLLALEPHPRNRVLLRLMYAAGLRVSEVCGLKWRDMQERQEGAGQITIFGKGGKTRVVLLSPETWTEVLALKGEGGADAPVFPSRKGKGHLHPSQVKRIIQAAAERAGIAAPVSPHWLRHAHASHALDRGAPIHLVQATLGHASVATTGRYLHARPEDSSARYLGV